MTNGSLYPFGRESYSKKAVIFVTAVTALPALIGFWGTFDVGRGFPASIYLAVCLFWYVVVQPKLICTHCAYYGKVCARGLGAVAQLLYRSGTGHEVWGARLGKVFWPWWYAGLPAAAFAYLLLFRFSWLVVVFAAGFVVTSALALLVNRNQCCLNCLMRTVCRRSPFRERA
ncbi:MAG: hypothetical protein JSU81_08530 [Candidatus Coatesbacteria bacterium]|nr:MAG: hypothetical protein JSU81_08530 [Candidatus Coatesbacteria bacterium]